jgi:hypothetical protein
MPDKKKAKKSPAVPVQSAGPGMMFSKDSFFIPNRGPNGGKVSIPVAPVVPVPQYGSNNNRFQFPPQKRFVYEQGTGIAYAEWIDGVAVCVHTGQELFRSRGFAAPLDESYGSESGVMQPHDYSVPKQQHPNDFSISTDDMLASGFITLEDFKAPNGAAVRLVDYEIFLKQKRDDGVM